jgi:hypothetical protein
MSNPIVRDTNNILSGIISQFIESNPDLRKTIIIGEDHMPEPKDLLNSIGKQSTCIDLVSNKTGENFAVFSECTRELAPMLKKNKNNNLMYGLVFGKFRNGKIVYSNCRDRIAQRETKTTTDEDYGKEIEDCFTSCNTNCVIGILGMLHIPLVKRYLRKQGIQVLCINIASFEMFEGVREEFAHQVQGYQQSGGAVPPGLEQVLKYYHEIPKPIPDSEEFYITGQRVEYICRLLDTNPNSPELLTRSNNICTQFKRNMQVTYTGESLGSMCTGDVGIIQSFDVKKDKFVVKFERTIIISDSKFELVTKRTGIGTGTGTGTCTAAGAGAGAGAGGGGGCEAASEEEKEDRCGSATVQSEVKTGGSSFKKGDCVRIIEEASNISGTSVPILGLIGKIHSYDVDKKKYVIIFEREVMIRESKLSKLSK